MASRSVIEDLDIIEDIGTSELTGFVGMFAASFTVRNTAFEIANRHIKMTLQFIVAVIPAQAGIQFLGYF